jgi:hypothetical protein
MSTICRAHASAVITTFCVLLAGLLCAAMLELRHDLQKLEKESI